MPHIIKETDCVRITSVYEFVQQDAHVTIIENPLNSIIRSSCTNAEPLITYHFTVSCLKTKMQTSMISTNPRLRSYSDQFSQKFYNSG